MTVKHDSFESWFDTCHGHSLSLNSSCIPWNLSTVTIPYISKRAMQPFLWWVMVLSGSSTFIWWPWVIHYHPSIWWEHFHIPTAGLFLSRETARGDIDSLPYAYYILLFRSFHVPINRFHWSQHMTGMLIHRRRIRQLLSDSPLKLWEDAPGRFGRSMWGGELSHFSCQDHAASD